MSKLVLDVEIGELKDNMVIHYNKSKRKWESICFADFNKKLYDEVIKQKQENARLQMEIDNIHEVLERHKKALQLLTKE